MGTTASSEQFARWRQFLLQQLDVVVVFRGVKIRSMANEIVDVRDVSVFDFFVHQPMEFMVGVQQHGRWRRGWRVKVSTKTHRKTRAIKNKKKQQKEKNFWERSLCVCEVGKQIIDY